MLRGEAYEEVNGTLTNPFDTFTIDRSYELTNSLSGGAAIPSTGGTGTTFTFQVTYTNSGGQPPAQATLLLDSLAPIAMTQVSGSYAGGAVYQYQTTLGFGAHQFAFDFGPGLRWPASGTIPEPTVDDAPAAPAPLAPADGAAGVQPDGLTLTWSGGNPNAGAGDLVLYDLYLGTPALPAAPTQSGLTTTNYTPPPGRSLTAPHMSGRWSRAIALTRPARRRRAGRLRPSRRRTSRRRRRPAPARLTTPPTCCRQSS